jgi:hypothetical protein
MYAVVKYEDYRKEQSFEVIITADDLDYVKKVAFQYAVNDIKKISGYANDSIYRITTKVENEYLRSINKTIISYKVIEVEKYKKRFKISSSFSSRYAVIEVKKDIDIENIQEIDTSILCDEYYNYDGEGYYNEDDEEE